MYNRVYTMPVGLEGGGLGKDTNSLSLSNSISFYLFLFGLCCGIATGCRGGCGREACLYSTVREKQKFAMDMDMDNGGA